MIIFQEHIFHVELVKAPFQTSLWLSALILYVINLYRAYVTTRIIHGRYFPNTLITTTTKTTMIIIVIITNLGAAICTYGFGLPFNLSHKAHVKVHPILTEHLRHFTFDLYNTDSGFCGVGNDPKYE
jgi:hypothetical protein